MFVEQIRKIPRCSISLACSKATVTKKRQRGKENLGAGLPANYPVIIVPALQDKPFSADVVQALRPIT
jgi:hypothetical protein